MFFILYRVVRRTWRGVLTPGYFELCSFPSDDTLQMRLRYFLSPPQGYRNCQIRSGTRRYLPYPIKRPESPSNPITVTMKNGTRMSIKSSKNTVFCAIAFWPPSELALCQQKEAQGCEWGHKHANCIILHLAFWRERDGTDSQGLTSVTSTKTNSEEGELREWTGVKKTPAVKVVPLFWSTPISWCPSSVPRCPCPPGELPWANDHCHLPATHQPSTGESCQSQLRGASVPTPFSTTPPPSSWSRPHIPSSLLTLSGLQPCVLGLFYPQQPHQFSPNSNLPSNI